VPEEGCREAVGVDHVIASQEVMSAADACEGIVEHAAGAGDLVLHRVVVEVPVMWRHGRLIGA